MSELYNLHKIIDSVETFDDFEAAVILVTYSMLDAKLSFYHSESVWARLAKKYEELKENTDKSE